MGDIFRRHCEQGNVAQIQEMLTTFGDSPVVNELDDLGKSPVFLCAAYGKAEALQVLLSAGLDATYANDGGFSPLTIEIGRAHV
jgi:ankyrin repeat protein